MEFPTGIQGRVNPGNSRKFSEFSEWEFPVALIGTDETAGRPK